ncbi:acyltransferase family protein [Pusillimonas sp. MFBS29]|uniref:acyltransferase n=1 Tax=Pusillimonas sp. MFBS29 TaxID=2886690 RepID=UPI001D0FD536|nr:acyltransferase family protein [Pusillimonas sp. MFBS29]MCC2596610.1 acyltransferase family protein [Pusillimonas sp. MFBS29]
MSQAGNSTFSTAMDTARVGACFMVVLLHAAAVNFAVFDEQWWASNFYDSLTRSCVPIFLMITGVLLLGRQESMPVFFRKRFARILPPLLFWSLFYMIWNTWEGERYGAWYDWIKELLNGPVTFHLWYLYAIVGIYLFVPFLRKIWHATLRSERRLYLIFWAVVCAWPTVREVLHIEADLLKVYGADSFFGLVGYLFLGAYVHEAYTEHPDKRRYWFGNVVLFLVFSVLTMTATYTYSVATGTPQTLFYDYLSPFVLASSVCAFNVLYGLGTKAGEYAGPVNKVAACTLGIYCIHIFVLSIMGNATGLTNAAASSWWAIPFTAVCVFAVSLAMIMVLRRIRPFQFVT